MTEFRARIRSVRWKDGGASLRLFPTPLNENGENLRGVMIDHAKMIAGHEGELDGFVIIGFWDDGRRSFGCRIPQRIPREMVPAYLSEIARTDVCTEHEFQRNFHWAE